MKKHRKSQHEVRINAHQRSRGSRKRVGDEKISTNCRGFPEDNSSSYSVKLIKTVAIKTSAMGTTTQINSVDSYETIPVS